MIRRFFGAVALACLVVQAAPAQAPDTWETILLPDPGAVYCSTASSSAPLCLTAFCVDDYGVLSLLPTGGPTSADEAEMSLVVDDRLSFLIGLTRSLVDGQVAYSAPLYAGEGWRMVDGLISGTRAVVTVDFGGGEMRYEMSLRGSSRAIMPVVRFCPNPDPEFDPSDSFPGEAGAPGEVCDDDLTQYEVNGCLAQGGGDVMSPLYHQCLADLAAERSC